MPGRQPLLLPLPRLRALPLVLTVFATATQLACQKPSTRPPDPVTPGAAPAKVSALDTTPDANIAPQATRSDDDALPLTRISLPPGFEINLYAAGVKDARSMALSPSGTLYVGTREDGAVYAIPNADGDARGDRVVTLAKGLHSPNGVAFHQGTLYVAEQNRIIAFDDVESGLARKPDSEQKLPFRVVKDGYPDEDHHGWKFLAIGPDEKLYVPIGAPCNVCDEKDPRFASITRLGLDGKGFEIFARGIRNTVGFAWHPTTKELWFTENGRDRMGDDVPPDELNRAPKAGLHFGFPYCHAGTVQDPEFGKKKKCSATTQPVRLLAPHVAALGMRFYTGKMFPPEYQNQILFAEHGSWNRSEKIGYRLMLVRLEGNTATSYEVFAQGWLHDDKAWGRPVDVQQAPDGALLVSDDLAGAIYRISHRS